MAGGGRSGGTGESVVAEGGADMRTTGNPPGGRVTLPAGAAALPAAGARAGAPGEKMPWTEADGTGMPCRGERRDRAITNLADDGGQELRRHGRQRREEAAKRRYFQGDVTV